MTSKNSLTPAQIGAIINAVKDVDLTDTEAWNDLDILSSNTRIEAIEVFGEEIKKNGKRIAGPINVYVTLNYPENTTLSERFPGRFEGEWSDGKPEIHRITVNTSSFTG